MERGFAGFNGVGRGKVDFGLVSRVARSFAITIRLLPFEIRETVALGYLLARASDSIADSSAADIGRRVEALEELRSGRVGAARLGELARLQTDAAEGELLKRMSELLAVLRESPDYERLKWVWDHILRGQLFDLTRFAVAGTAPLTSAELDDYTYAVAGSVGEFWTELAFERVRNFSRVDRDEMVRRGVSYGKGLQRINILRDRAADRQIGRVYVTESDFDQVRAEAREGLEAGLAWAEDVNRRRLRFACVLPARIGLAMLPDLRVDAERKVKISRRRLRGVMLAALPVLFLRIDG